MICPYFVSKSKICISKLMGVDFRAKICQKYCKICPFRSQKYPSSICFGHFLQSFQFLSLQLCTTFIFITEAIITINTPNNLKITLKNLWHLLKLCCPPPSDLFITLTKKVKKSGIYPFGFCYFDTFTLKNAFSKQPL